MWREQAEIRWARRGIFIVTCVAVDCIALNYWGKHKRKMAIRGINWQESNQQQ